MLEIDLSEVNSALVQCLRVLEAARVMIRNAGIHCEDLDDMVREVRLRASEIQKARELMKESEDLVLVIPGSGG